MRPRTKGKLILLNLLVIVLIAVITLFPSHILRIILGLPFVLFFPVYTLVTALFIKKEGLDSIERVVVSCVMSIALVSLFTSYVSYCFLEVCTGTTGQYLVLGERVKNLL